MLHGWSVLLAVGQLHAVLQPGTGPSGGQPVAWWQAHQPLQVTDGWRAAANKHQQVLMFAAPVGSIGRQPREDLLREALDKAAANGRLVGGGAAARRHLSGAQSRRGLLLVRRPRAVCGWSRPPAEPHIVQPRVPKEARPGRIS